MKPLHARLGATLVIAVGLTIGALGAAGSAASTTGCTQVNGHLVVDITDGQPDRMIGKINGEYAYTFQGVVPSANNPQVTYVEGRSVVMTNKGALRFIENSASTALERATNNATLMTVEGGTGAWSGATGFVALRGYFHNSSLSGEFDYRGEVCLP